jgi:nicotinamide phosphoribosyltransferase
MELTKKHYGDYSDKELKKMTPEQLIAIIMETQNDDNFIIMSDSYKMTHHLLYPDGLNYVSSYMEPRGGDMPYTVFCMLQYYLKRYVAGRRITPEKIEEARQANIAHFGFDCFDDTMWYHIYNKHNGFLPLRITAIPEGTPIAVKNVLMTMCNTDPKCAPLTNITETLFMKLWAPNTVAAYNRIIKELITRFHAITSDVPAFLIDFMHHDFGYRGVSSEETGRLMSAAAMISFSGTDTMGGLSLIKKHYFPLNTPWSEAMSGYSVIASEHSVMCAYGGRHKEPEAYRAIIEKVKNDEKIKKANPASGVIILSLVSDTYNIYNVVHRILPMLQAEFIGWTNDNGIPIKIVVRPDSGCAANVLFGYNEIVHAHAVNAEATPQRGMVKRVAADMDITFDEALEIVNKGIFQILFEKFGSTVNSKGYKVLHPQIGVLQGDGVSLSVIREIYEIMINKDVKIDIMCLVFGSGGKNLQAHDRDEQKYAIKATKVEINGVPTMIEKNPITDSGKKSKKGELKLIRTKKTDDPTKEWMNFETLQEGMEGFDEAVSILEPVFLNGEILKEYSFPEVRTNALVTYDAAKHTEFLKASMADR